MACHDWRKRLTSSARMCLFFWLKNFEGSERVLKVNFMYSQSNLGPQIPVFFPAPVSFAWVTFLFFLVFLRMGIMALTQLEPTIQIVWKFTCK